MYDLLAFIIGFFLLCILILVVIVGLKFLYRIFNVKTSEATEPTHKQEYDKQLEEESKEDSNGDGLVLFDDPLFPEELDDDNE